MGFSESEKLKITSAVTSCGGEAHFFDRTVSTNSVLREMGRNGVRDGTTVIADTQTGGRGRKERRWVSPTGGNLFMSMLFRPDLSLAVCPATTFMASLALSDTFDGFGMKSEIKWPNDILADGGKIAGVLSEVEPAGDLCDFIVIGIGVNINLSRENIDNLMKDFSDRATSMSEILGHDVDRGEFTSALIKNLFVQNTDLVSKGHNWTVARWAARWGKLNETVKINDDGTEIEGVARKVDAHGFLHLETQDGNLVKIVSGDAE
ncbi:MAG: biotin--[acetyl-CoA-carboxylase] ligase [Candidatus Mycalebacterium zealandia]|nr:MAG: biotin--[acetyl-CoA-carboxylase] ligase [Candidatus Mycalebacterium zealandia]